jgi:hypothetical protein
MKNQKSIYGIYVTEILISIVKKNHAFFYFGKEKQIKFFQSPIPSVNPI